MGALHYADGVQNVARHGSLPCCYKRVEADRPFLSVGGSIPPISIEQRIISLSDQRSSVARNITQAWSYDWAFIAVPLKKTFDFGKIYLE